MRGVKRSGWAHPRARNLQKHLDARLRAAADIALDDESTDEFLSVQEAPRAFVEHNLFGADFDPFLVRAAQTNVLMASNGQSVVRVLRRKDKTLDDDLPRIAEAYRTFLAQQRDSNNP